MHNMRHWWYQVFASTTHDLLNPRRAWSGTSGHFLSGLHLPEAQPQPEWSAFDEYEITSGALYASTAIARQQHHNLAQ